MIESMFGECSGKTRSTPSPKLILRTVKLAAMPEPLLRAMHDALVGLHAASASPR